MSIELKNATDPNIHEPKGVAAALVGYVYRSDGAGSGAWILTDPHANFHYTDLSSASTMSVTTSYAKMDDAAMSSNFANDNITIEMTYADGRMTYTGTLTRDFFINSHMSIDQSSGASRDVQFALYKNGVIIDHAEMIMTTSSGDKVSGSLAAELNLATNDYIEIYTKASASITLNVYSLYCAARGGIGL